MCYNFMQIKSTSSQGQQFSYVPCGKCEECRNSSKSAWSFRLCAEVESVKRKGWHVGFLTMTYSPDRLPILPDKYFKDSVQVVPDIPCFDKEHVRSYIKAFRNWLFKKYLVKNISYMVVSEYGTKKHRPHYHMLVCWPPVGFARIEKRRYFDVNHKLCVEYEKEGRKFKRQRVSLTADVVFNWLKSNWTYGLTFPDYVTGGGTVTRPQQPFEVENAGYFACKYAAKYICKDLTLDKVLSQSEITEDEDLRKEMRRYSSFHMQSQSLGFALVKEMDDSARMKLIEDGYCFDVDDGFKQIPLYIRNKLFFNLDYCIAEDIDEDTGEVTYRRLVRRQANQFFRTHYQEIFERRSCYYVDLINDVCRSDFWISRGMTPEAADFSIRRVSELLSRLKVSRLQLAQDYLAYYGLSSASCYDVSRSIQWFSRYTSVYDSQGLEMFNELDFSKCDHVDLDYLGSLNLFWTNVFECLRRTNGYIKHNFDVDEVVEFWKKEVA